MVSLIFLSLLFLIAVGIAVSAHRWKYEPYRGEEKSISWVGYLVAAVLALVAIAWLLSTVIVSVPTKEIGVVKAFGKPTGELSNGLHTKAPWETVTNIDAAIQTDNYLNGPQDQGNDNTIPVRIANQSIAGVEVSVRWRIRPEAATRLYQDYKAFSHVRDSLVTRNLRSALNENFANYNPLLDLQAGKVPQDVLSGVGFNVNHDLSQKIGDQVDVLSVIIPLVNFDDGTQAKINQFQQAQSDTRIAEQNVKTAHQQALANQELSASLKNDPNVLVARCLDAIKGHLDQLPIGFSCWPGGSATSVVVPQK